MRFMRYVVRCAVGWIIWNVPCERLTSKLLGLYLGSRGSKLEDK